MSLADKTYLITGAASGIGAAIAKRLADQGAKIISVDVQQAAISADLSIPEGRSKAIAAIRNLAADGLDGVIPCAGIGPSKPPAQVLALNYFGVMDVVHGVLDLLAKRQGTLLLISSTSAPMGMGKHEELLAALLAQDEPRSIELLGDRDGQTAYSMSKLGLSRWMRENVRDIASKGIRLCAIAPGLVMTALTQQEFENPQYAEAMNQYISTIPAKRAGKPEDIAAAANFLLSAEASYCHGLVMFVDGGSDAADRPDQF